MTGRKRADLGFTDALENLDIGEFKPRRTPVRRPAAALTGQAAEAAGFRSREPKAEALPHEPLEEARPAQQRRRRTGRNMQFNLKAKPETIAAYCALADRMGWGLGETLEKAVDLLEAEYGDRSGGT